MSIAFAIRMRHGHAHVHIHGHGHVHRTVSKWHLGGAHKRVRERLPGDWLVHVGTMLSITGASTVFMRVLQGLYDVLSTDRSNWRGRLSGDSD